MQVLEVETEIIETTISNCIVDDNNNKNQINELKGTLDMKNIQAEEHSITISSAETLTKTLLKDENKNEK